MFASDLLKTLSELGVEISPEGAKEMLRRAEVADDHHIPLETFLGLIQRLTRGISLGFYVRRLRMGETALGLWMIDGVLKSHGPCVSFERSVVQIGLETTELRGNEKCKSILSLGAQASWCSTAPRPSAGPRPTTGARFGTLDLVFDKSWCSLWCRGVRKRAESVLESLCVPAYERRSNCRSLPKAERDYCGNSRASDTSL